MGVWDHIPPDELARRTKNYGLAGGWLMPPQVMVCPLCGGGGILSTTRKDEA